MPRLISRRLALVCTLVFAFALSTAAVAAAKGTSANLRVAAGGKTLAQETLKTGTFPLPTSSKATCFGKGTGGSGKPVKIQGPTALGLLGQAAKSNKALQPLLVSDSFDFGLGLCGIGGYSASSKLSWYLKVNHKNPEIGGEVVKLKPRDDVLWALAPFPYPNELVLDAPEAAEPGIAFSVRVFSYNDKGKKKPASGASVTGASAPTGADGSTIVVLSEPATLVATHGKDIPSNQEAVCVAGKCPSDSGS